MAFESIDAWWWPYLFILLGGWIATDSWRWLGVWFGGKLDADSEMLVFVRALATALVAAVIANLIVFPSGVLAGSPLWLRLTAAAGGFAAYLLFGRRVWLGVVAAEAILIPGLLLSGL